MANTVKSVKIFTDPTLKKFWRVLYNRAASKVSFQITQDLWNRAVQKAGEHGRGDGLGCVLAWAIWLIADEMPHLFPHKVIMPYVWNSRAFIIDKQTKGKPVHAVQYAHDLGLIVRIYDKQGASGVAKLLESGERIRFTLRPVPIAKPHPSFGRPNDRNPTRRDYWKLGVGALRRARHAGLVVGTATAS